MNVWTYWEGPMWPHIRVCLESMRKWIPNLEVLTPETVHQYTGSLPNRVEQLEEIGPKTIIYRAALLYEHGGIWLDADTIVLKPLGDLPWDSNLMYMEWPFQPRRIITGCLGCKARSPIVSDWMRRASNWLSKEPSNTGWWLNLGERCLTPAVRDTDVPANRIPLHTFFPLSFDDGGMQQLVETRDPEYYIKPETVAFGLNHSWLIANHKALMLTWPDDSPILIHKLLLKASKR